MTGGAAVNGPAARAHPRRDPPHADGSGAVVPPDELGPAAWQEAVARVQLPDHWRSRMRYAGTEGVTVRVVVPDSFTRYRIMTRYLQDLRRHLVELTGRPVRVSLQVVPRRR